MQWPFHFTRINKYVTMMIRIIDEVIVWILW